MDSHAIKTLAAIALGLTLATGCLGGTEAPQAPQPQAPDAEQAPAREPTETEEDNAAVTTRVNETFHLEATMLHTPVQDVAMGNCIGLFDTDPGTTLIKGTIAASWTPALPANEQLVLWFTNYGADAQMQVEGTTPLALELTEQPVHDPGSTLHALWHFRPGNSLPADAYAHQAIKVDVDLTLSGDTEVDLAVGTCS